MALLLDAFAGDASVGGQACLVFEDCACTLRAMQLRCRPAGLPLPDVQRLMHQLVSAVAYLHEQRVMHRHLRPECILLKANGLLKLSGMNSAVLMPKGIKSVGRATLPISSRMTSIYSAPEVLLEENIGFAADVWAIGCICAELITGKGRQWRGGEEGRLPVLKRGDGAPPLEARQHCGRCWCLSQLLGRSEGAYNPCPNGSGCTGSRPKVAGRPTRKQGGKCSPK